MTINGQKENIMNKCSSCNGIILFGGVSNKAGKFCNDDCYSNHCIAFADRIIPKEQMDSMVNEARDNNCSHCKGSGPVDLHKATKITSYVVAYTVNTSSIVSCGKCGKKHKIFAGIHTLFLGIWSPKGLLHSIFYFPAGIIGGLLTSVKDKPSKSFVNAIKANVGMGLIEKI